MSGPSQTQKSECAGEVRFAPDSGPPLLLVGQTNWSMRNRFLTALPRVDMILKHLLVSIRQKLILTSETPTRWRACASCRTADTDTLQQWLPHLRIAMFADIRTP
jgi:hypothetical protein